MHFRDHAALPRHEPLGSQEAPPHRPSLFSGVGGMGGAIGMPSDMAADVWSGQMGLRRTSRGQLCLREGICPTTTVSTRGVGGKTEGWASRKHWLKAPDLPHLGKNFPELGNNLPGLGNNFPELGKNFAELGKCG